MSEMNASVLIDKYGKKLLPKDARFDVLKAENAGKLLKVSDEGAAAVAKYTQPEWGSETAMVEIMPETTLLASDFNADDGWGIGQFQTVPKAGGKAVVTYNGEVYECGVEDMSQLTSVAGSVGFGNEYFFDDPSLSDVPFFVIYFNADVGGGLYGTIMPTSTENVIDTTVKIISTAETIHEIPLKYIEHEPFYADFEVSTQTLLCAVAEILAAISAGKQVYLRYLYNGEILENSIYAFIGIDPSMGLCFLRTIKQTTSIRFQVTSIVSESSITSYSCDVEFKIET